MSPPTILPTDLILEILSWLPVKLLVRFTCISKLWKSLIFDSSFTKLHLQKSSKNTHVLLTLHEKINDVDTWVVAPYSLRNLLEHPSTAVNEDEYLRFNNNTYYAVGSTNGLVCLMDDYSQQDGIQAALAILRGRLCLYYDHMKTHFVLWEMREFGVQESWIRLINVSYVHLQFNNFAPDDVLPVCLSENGDLVLMANKEQVDVIKYNSSDDRVEYIQLPNNQIWYADEHMQSLVLPLPDPHKGLFVDC